jgi:hypothetical protein
MMIALSTPDQERWEAALHAEALLVYIDNAWPAKPKRSSRSHFATARLKTCTLANSARPAPATLGISHITQDEMKRIMRNAVDNIYRLLWLRENDPEKYEAQIELGDRYTSAWDDPVQPPSA